MSLRLFYTLIIITILPTITYGMKRKEPDNPETPSSCIIKVRVGSQKIQNVACTLAILNKGKKIGHSEGFSVGQKIGYAKGFATGKEQGYTEGVTDGYTAGVSVKPFDSSPLPDDYVSTTLDDVGTLLQNIMPYLSSSSTDILTLPSVDDMESKEELESHIRALISLSDETPKDKIFLQLQIAQKLIENTKGLASFQDQPFAQSSETIYIPDSPPPCPLSPLSLLDSEPFEWI